MTPSGKITWCDDLFCRRFGYSLEQLRSSDFDVLTLVPALKLAAELNNPQYVTCMGQKMAPTPCTVILNRASVDEPATGGGEAQSRQSPSPSGHLSSRSVDSPLLTVLSPTAPHSVTPTNAGGATPIGDSSDSSAPPDELVCTMHVYTTLSGQSRPHYNRDAVLGFVKMVPKSGFEICVFGSQHRDQCWGQNTSPTQRPPPLVRTNSSVLTTLPIFYGICMRNHSIIIRMGRRYGAGAKTRPESRIKKFNPHCMYD